MSEELKAAWKRAISRNRELTAKDIFDSAILNPEKIHYRTICRALREMGINPYMKKRKFFLGGADGKRKRLGWCKRQLKLYNRDRSYFDRILWSDESQIFASRCGRAFIRRKRGQKINEKYIEQQKQANGGL